MSVEQTSCVAWQDNRSGQAGQMVGNLVLAHLCGRGEEVTRVKGTMFSTPRRLLIGRVCSSSSYLLGGARHFCNISKPQHKGVLKYAAAEHKPAEYVFITADPEKHVIDIWTIPARVITEVLQRLKTKSSDRSCLVRVRKDGNRYVLNNGQDVTRYHSQIPLAKGDARRIGEAMKTEFERAPRDLRLVVASPKRRNVTATIGGRPWKGVLTPAR